MNDNPFGMVMPGRKYTAGSGYMYGFNGKENDKETGWQDYGFRIYDNRLGRFLSVDPLTSNYPYYTPYQFAGNKPIWAIDLDGLEPEITNVRAYVNKDRTVIDIYADVDIKVQVINLTSSFVPMTTITQYIKSDLENNIGGTSSMVTQNFYDFFKKGPVVGIRQKTKTDLSTITANYHLNATVNASEAKTIKEIKSDSYVFGIVSEITGTTAEKFGDVAGVANMSGKVALGESNYMVSGSKSRNLILHELLHLFGLDDWHDNPDKKDIINPMNSLNRSSLVITSDQKSSIALSLVGPWNWVWNTMFEGNYKQTPTSKANAEHSAEQLKNFAHENSDAEIEKH